jgi:hypothetical protein
MKEENMTNVKTYQQNFDDTLSLFDRYVKKELETWQNVKVLSFEANRMQGNSFLSILDQKVGCDLGLWNGEDLYFAANRIYPIDPSRGYFPMSITLRNDTNGSYDLAEINKLKRLCDLNGKQLHHPMPSQMIFSRVVREPQPYLLDMVIVDTVVLIDFLFDMRKFNLIALRERYRQYRQQGIEVNGVDFSTQKSFWGGIRRNTADGNTFVAISTMLLDEYNVPYRYRKFAYPMVVEDYPVV